MTPEAADLIKRLMDRNPATRLGANGVEEVQQHSFFHGFDWGNVRNIQAPVVPKVRDLLDSSNFDKCKLYSDVEQSDPFFGLKAEGKDEVSSECHLNHSHVVCLIVCRARAQLVAR